ncbi:MAG: thioesterase family protein [Bacteroidia bacterium]|nr:thioesterase family protein [Bacteroidia bacterium]
MASFQTEIRIRYGETDQMGFCYYGNYAQFLEVARVETLRKLGISYKELEEKGILLPVRNYSIKYIAPAKYDDIIQINTEISDIKNSQIIFKYSIYLEQKLIATARTELVFVSKENYKPIKVPADFKFLAEKIQK